jgi:quercetin dioxygenase-like cupin family protein
MAMIESAPQMVILDIGKSFKVLQITGSEGMSMPPHLSTKEAVITILRGTATLSMSGNNHSLKEHESMIIPAGEKHSLQINQDFQAHVIMESDSQIKFID